MCEHYSKTSFKKKEIFKENNYGRCAITSKRC